MGKIFPAAMLAAAMALGACGTRESPPVSAFEGRLADWTREILRDSPETASLAGAPPEAAGGRYDNRLDDRSLRAVETRRGAALRRLAEIRALDASELSAAERLNYDVIAAQFDAAAAGADFAYGDFTPLGGPRPYVLTQLDSAFTTLPALLHERQRVASAADAEAYLRRLEAAAVAIAQETERARADADAGVRPPGFIIDATIAMLDGILAQPAQAQPYYTSFARALEAYAAAEQDATRRAAIERANPGLLARAELIVRERILPAHRRAADFLRADRRNAGDDPSVSRLPNGAAFYAAALRFHTTTTLSPEEIHRIGLLRVAALSRELDIALRRMGLTEGAVGQRLAAISVDPRYRYEDSDEGRAQLLADVRARVARALEHAPQWFQHLPQAALEVRRVPAYAETGQPGAYYSPPALDGSAPGIYYVNLRDLSEMTRIDLPTQDYHEAVPGHHFQTALAQEIDAPLLRRLIGFNAYSEGWGLYAEQLVDEAGFYDEDPVGRIGYLRWQLWRAARLVVDTGLHAQGWSRERAIAYLQETTGDAAGVVATEVDRYIVWPGQACGYELGRREIERLRELARNQLGPDFDLRGFHNAVLAQGETPLPVLESLVRQWIPEQRRLAERERRRR